MSENHLYDKIEIALHNAYVFKDYYKMTSPEKVAIGIGCLALIFFGGLVLTGIFILKVISVLSIFLLPRLVQ